MAGELGQAAKAEKVTGDMDRLLFGDNQFFGINHMSEEKAVAQAMRFRDVDAILAVLGTAYDTGVTTFMCTTHERIGEVCDRVRADPAAWDQLVFYPGMPYAHKYANAVTEHGLVKAVQRSVPDEGYVDAVLRGGTSVMKKDVTGLVTLLVDAEMKMFHGLRTPVVFLQNVVVDLILGLRAYELFDVFAEHVRATYDAEPGFITMNLPMLLDALDGLGHDNPIVCANLNKIGFRMSGGIEANEEALESRECRAIAMSVLASGAVSPREAFEWVAAHPRIASVVFGASTRAHIEDTVAVANELWPASV